MRGTASTRHPSALCALLVTAVLACSAERVAEPVKPIPAYTLTITGDTVGQVGERVVMSATVKDSTGAVINGQLVTWTVSDTAVLNPTSLFSSTQTISVPDFVGKAEGTVTVTASWYKQPQLIATATVRVRDARPLVTLSLGQTVVGQVVNGVSTSRYAISLAAGESIDIMTDKRDSLSTARLRQMTGGLSLTPTLGYYGGPNIYGGVAVPASGTYVMDVLGDHTCLRGSCKSASGGFTLSVRRAGPIFTYLLNPRGNVPTAAPAGGVTAETLYVQNVGAGTLNVNFTSEQSNFAFDKTLVSVTGPSKPSTDGSIPAGAVPVVVRIDLRDPAAATGGWIHLLPDASAWSLVGNDVRWRVTLNVYDPAIRLLAQQYVDGITAPPSGPLYAVAGPRILSIDRTSGAVTQLRFDNRNYQEIFSAADGTIYVHSTDYSAIVADTLSRLYPDGRLETVLTNAAATTVTVAPDGTIYFARSGTLNSRSPAGQITSLATGVVPERAGMIYHPQDNALYYVQNSVLRRFDLATRQDTPRGTVKRFRVQAVDAKGRLVGYEEFSGDCVFLDTNAQVVTRVILPATGTAVSIIGNTMYGGGPPSTRTNYVWTRPLP